MEQTIAEVLKQSPIAIVLFWMVNVFSKRDEDNRADLRGLHERIINVIENNTKAVSEVNAAVISNMKATETLSDRIYDVLTKNDERNSN